MDQDIKTVVGERYAEIARKGFSSRDESMRRIAVAFGYSDDELASIPAEANMGLSCGNPTAMASLREGETVVDLGSGGGLDVFLAALRVGPTGSAIGIDMTPDMVALARRNADKAGHSNVAFHRADIDDMPLDDDSVDCVISNCVLNLVPDKSRAFHEIYRILKPGGRLAVSDIALKQPLPPAISDSVAAYTGCIAGALVIAEYERLLRQAGFASVRIVDSEIDLNLYNDCAAPDSEQFAACCGTAEPVADEGLKALRTIDVNDYAAGVKVFAVK